MVALIIGVRHLRNKLNGFAVVNMQPVCAREGHGEAVRVTAFPIEPSIVKDRVG